MSSGPQYRAAVCKAILAILRQDAQGRAALARLDPRIPEAIDDAGSLGWLDAELLDSINTAYLEFVGSDAYIEFWRRYTVSTKDSPLFKRLFDGAVRIFGLRPRGLLGWFGRAWEATTRGYGEATCTRADTSGIVIVRGLPIEGRRISVALTMKAAALGILDLTHHHGEVRLDTSRLESDGVVRVDLEWVALDRSVAH